MSTMVRTQVYIPRDVYEELKRRGKSTGLAMAEQIRQALREYLDREESVVLREDDPIWNIVGAISTDDGDLSIRHDKYLYGWKEDEWEPSLTPGRRGIKCHGDEAATP